MASRFASTRVDPRFIDYAQVLPEKLLVDAATAQASFIDNALLTADKQRAALLGEAAPGQEARLAGLNNSFNNQIDNITNEILKDPLNYRSQLPSIKKLSSAITQSMSTGELGAMNRHTQSYKDLLTGAKDTYKDNPELYQYYKKRLDRDVSSMKYDSNVNTFGAINSPQMQRHLSDKELQDWLVKASNLVKDEYLGKLTDVHGNNIEFEDLGKFQKMYTTGQITGTTYNKVMTSLSHMVTPEIIGSVQQYSNATDKRNALTGQPVDESKFFDQTTGQLDINTTIGSLIHGGALARQSKNVESQSGVMLTDRGFQMSKEKVGRSGGKNNSTTTASPEVLKQAAGKNPTNHTTIESGKNPFEGTGIPLEKDYKKYFNSRNEYYQKYKFSLEEYNKLNGNSKSDPEKLAELEKKVRKNEYMFRYYESLYTNPETGYKSMVKKKVEEGNKGYALKNKDGSIIPEIALDEGKYIINGKEIFEYVEGKLNPIYLDITTDLAKGLYTGKIKF